MSVLGNFKRERLECPWYAIMSENLGKQMAQHYFLKDSLLCVMNAALESKTKNVNLDGKIYFYQRCRNMMRAYIGSYFAIKLVTTSKTEHVKKIKTEHGDN